MHSQRRGLFHIPKLQLSTSAPLGLFVLTRIRHEPLELIVLPAAVPWESGLGDIVGGKGDQWHDLRAYVSGDALSRVHWRKANGDITSWVVKRFSSPMHHANHPLLRVDLRMPSGFDQDAFEQLLGRAYGWIQDHEHFTSTFILGQAEFDLSQPIQYRQALKALASAQPESGPPAGQDGLLLCLGDGGC